jgi:hypothetical protein
LKGVREIGKQINQMAKKNPRMVLNLKSFLSSMVNCIVDEQGDFIFDLFEVEEIVNAALQKDLPSLTAKQWNVGGRTK